ncbi:MAG: hypothetical protein VXW31_01960 [Planctomycetota bacterium]|nr:hypothetical protein [Planctomycetota bacterium]
MATPTQLRDRVSRLAPQDPGGALALARSIPDPWFRSQALAQVVRFVAEHRVSRIAREALAAGAGCGDAYERCAIAAWTVKALVERGHTRAAETALQNALHAAASVDQAGARAEALGHLARAAGDLGPLWVEKAAHALVELGAEDGHWRVQRAIVRCAVLLASKDDEAARRVLSRVSSDSTRRSIRERLEGS